MRSILCCVCVLFTLFSFAQNGHTARIRALGFDAAGTQLLSGSVDGTVVLWDAQGRLVNTFHPPATEYREGNRMFSRVAFYRSGTYFLAAGLLEGYWGKTDDPELKQLKTGMMGGDRAFALSSDEKYIIIGQGLTEIKILTGSGEQTGQLVRTIPATGVSAIYPIPTQPSTFLAYSYISGLVHMDVNGTVISSFPSMTDRNVIAVSPRGDAFLYGETLYDLSGKKLAQLKAGDDMWDAAFSPDGQTIATTSGNSVLIWDRKGKKIGTIDSNQKIWSLAITPDGTRLVFGCDNGTIEMWTLTGRQVQVYK